MLARDRLLCAACVEDDFLRAEIELNGSDGRCSYCDLEGKTFSIDRIADLTEAALSEHFCCVTREPALDPEIQLEATDDASNDAAVSTSQAGSHRPAAAVSQHPYRSLITSAAAPTTPV